ncbi:mitochondrial carrier [Stereum hirsutum FP-91666 SS1]|uniref:mitochondrial carrier n=1 Tax=Stereum hirsutum (strain FP-91666) TaxID=721885 RepID=UPI000444A7C0|nr:mitochondrial carrier [Stereum hirsutum FP-91666 SS1]EIM85491.1 mitochondrial carrier [Stereum hirsutum FP-91666 SS1]
MHPLDLLKVKFQVATEEPKGNVGQQIWLALKGIKHNEGWRGLYRGVGPNIAGNASSWGLYFLFYNDLKRRATNNGTGPPLSAGQYLLCSAQASAVTAVITNPIWVVKVRMFTSRADNPTAYRGLWDGFRTIYRSEGIRGLYRGTLLALVGVSNGAVQFMMYEEMKKWGFERKRRRMEREGKAYTASDDHLSNTSYTVMSGGSKLAALTLTYPYQVIRSRMQNTTPVTSTSQNSTIISTIKHTYRNEGPRGFYRGLGTNLVRVLPGTCVTFVCYENLAWLLKRAAARREERAEGSS